jgi:hypothetical protein
MNRQQLFQLAGIETIFVVNFVQIIFALQRGFQVEFECRAMFQVEFIFALDLGVD